MDRVAEWFRRLGTHCVRGADAVDRPSRQVPAALDSCFEGRVVFRERVGEADDGREALVQEVRAVVADLPPLLQGGQAQQVRMRQGMPGDLVAIGRQVLKPAPRHEVRRVRADSSTVDIERAVHAVPRKRPADRILILLIVVERQGHDDEPAAGRPGCAGSREETKRDHRHDREAGRYSLAAAQRRPLSFALRCHLESPSSLPG